MERRLRKRQDSLYICGCGVLIFSLWSIIRTVLYLVLDTEGFQELTIAAAGTSHYTEGIIVALFVVLAIDLVFRIFVFRKATRDARGKKKVSPVYIIIAFFFVFVSVYSLAYNFTPGAVIMSWTDTIVTFIVELTSLITTVEMIYSAIVVRRLRRAIRKRDAQKQTELAQSQTKEN